MSYELVAPRVVHPNCPVGIFKFVGVYFRVGSWQTTALFFIEIKRLNFLKINKESLGNVPLAMQRNSQRAHIQKTYR
jgi:hypothetical protein